MSFNPFLFYLAQLEVVNRAIVLYQDESRITISKRDRVYEVIVESPQERKSIFCGESEVEGFYLRYGGVPFNETA